MTPNMSALPNTPSPDLETLREEIQATDKAITALFEKRMHLAEGILRDKMARGLPILDHEREVRLLEADLAQLSDPALREYYVLFLRQLMDLSKAYQGRLRQSEGIDPSFRTLACLTPQGSYDIVIGRGVLQRAGSLLDLDRKVLVVTDDGVPAEYAETVLHACREGFRFVLPQGEASKGLGNWQALLAALLDHGFTRSDAVVAVGGGMVGDLAGFAAAAYMRGIGFYNIPTTLLSQLDSSIGGKTGVDFGGVKNITGAFKQPDKVLIDPGCLASLGPRLLHEGLAEGIKMAATCDEELFRLIAGTDDLERDLQGIIEAALRIKRDIVQADTDEKGLRRVLNFGHTVGHAIEAAAGGRLFHGECVAAGMMYCCSDEVRSALRPVLEKYGLPTADRFDTDTLMSYVVHDKKASGGRFNLVQVDRIGSYAFRSVTAEEIRDCIRQYKRI